MFMLSIPIVSLIFFFFYNPFVCKIEDNFIFLIHAILNSLYKFYRLYIIPLYHNLL